MIKKKLKNDIKNNEDNSKELDNICEECLNKDESVSQNLIMYSYKLCNSCKSSKTLFPL